MRPPRAAICIAVAAACLPPFAAAAPACAVAEKDLVGAWGRPTGSAFFEEFALELDGGRHIFHSWLHSRPEVSGARWTYAQCRLHIEAANDPAMVFDYAVRMRGRARLVLRDGDGAATFRRLGRH